MEYKVIRVDYHDKSELFYESLYKLLHANLKYKKDFVLDMEKVEFMSSTILGLLAQFHKKLSNDGLEMNLINLNAPNKKIIKITNLERYFNVFDSFDEFDKELER